ncbi:class I SAM-dependent methyltransferase [Aurantiacibacter aquimixticola]|uniref:Methyltransferase domain-containing protein n=1 Tax=Aurantiacibacter aquimixticola TaxID=1958945 RepID=A0A419RSM4_9SPHN|nr:methyltransferase domain-containing protein [Aurantiacibacter aquimixticola]RJY08780.1 methyltransferase domain-containing protein [Aurantiacibacter aquimixticola]
MTDAQTNEAWNTFWERQTRTSGKGGGCLPEAWAAIDRVRARFWQQFAKRLPRGAKVLDLATGDGLVMAYMLEARRDLKPVGIDYATALPDAPKGTKMLGGVRMEELPFDGGKFDAVVSQFGFEYGDIPAVAKEIARVLNANGRVGIMSHRKDGPIVAHNRNRKAQIAWAIEEQDLLTVARNSLSLRNSGNSTMPEAIAQAPEKGAAAHGPSSAAWEIAEAIRRTLHLGRQDDPANVIAVLDDIERQASNELGRIASLERAAEAASDSDAVIAAMEQAGLELIEEVQLRDGRSPNSFAVYRGFKIAA